MTVGRLVWSAMVYIGCGSIPFCFISLLASTCWYIEFGSFVARVWDGLPFSVFLIPRCDSQTPFQVLDLSQLNHFIDPIQVQDADGSSGLAGPLPRRMLCQLRSRKCLLTHSYRSKISVLTHSAGEGVHLLVHGPSIWTQYSIKSFHQDDEAHSEHPFPAVHREPTG